MKNRKLIVLGSSGLLGSAIQRQAENKNVALLAVSRENIKDLEEKIGSPVSLLDEVGVSQVDMVINAIGKTKQLIDEDSEQSVNKAQWLNSIFPHSLAEACQSLGARVVQVGTDCVFSGRTGNYSESDKNDAKDPYGASKAAGEASEYLEVIRTSFVGDHPKNNLGLWHWVKNQPKNAKITGYTNHLWNGATTDVVAKVLISIFANNYPITEVQHLVPADYVSKYELVKMIATRSNRDDINVSPGEADTAKDMRLATNNAQTNAALWQLAGFKNAPTIEEMIRQQTTFGAAG